MSWEEYWVIKGVCGYGSMEIGTIRSVCRTCHEAYDIKHVEVRVYDYTERIRTLYNYSI